MRFSGDESRQQPGGCWCDSQQGKSSSQGAQKRQGVGCELKRARFHDNPAQKRAGRGKLPNQPLVVHFCDLKLEYPVLGQWQIAWQAGEALVKRKTRGAATRKSEKETPRWIAGNGQEKWRAVYHRTPPLEEHEATRWLGQLTSARLLFGYASPGRRDP